MPAKGFSYEIPFILSANLFVQERDTPNAKDFRCEDVFWQQFAERLVQFEAAAQARVQMLRIKLQSKACRCVKDFGFDRFRRPLTNNYGLNAIQPFRVSQYNRNLIAVYLFITACL